MALCIVQISMTKQQIQVHK